MGEWTMRHFSRAVFTNFLTAGLKQFLPRFDGALSLYVDRSQVTDYGEPEGEFKTSDGRSIPIFPRYRYTVKRPLLRATEPLVALDRRGLLNRQEAARLSAILGTRTLTEPQDNQIAFARSVARRMPEMFLPGWETDAEGPVIRQSEADVTRIVGKFKAQHKRMLRLFAAGDIVHLKPGASVLEIGYSTGGHSIFAFEKLGFKVHGVDNFYAGLDGDKGVWKTLKSQLNSRADFRLGDITRPTPYDPDSLDLIYSASTVEHIQDLPAAFAEMYRIVKPGGAIVHNFAPYYCVDGGHALGIGDTPWAHVRMTRDDFIRYIRQYRPFEAEAAERWFAGGLQFDMPQRRVQRLVSQAGFRIAAWLAKPSGKRFMGDLTPDVIRDCFVATPDIGLEDLTSRSVTFVAVKQG